MQGSFWRGTATVVGFGIQLLVLGMTRGQVMVAWAEVPFEQSLYLLSASSLLLGLILLLFLQMSSQCLHFTPAALKCGGRTLCTQRSWRLLYLLLRSHTLLRCMPR